MKTMMSMKIVVLFLIVIQMMTTHSASTRASLQRQQQNSIDFIPLALDTPFELKEALKPLRAQYFSVNATSSKYSALSISLICSSQYGAGVTSGCTTTTQINVTIDRSQMEHAESIWTKQENTTLPGTLITATSQPPFKPSFYYISVMTLTSAIDKAAVLVQAYSDK
jgi:hypothetical protein